VSTAPQASKEKRMLRIVIAKITLLLATVSVAQESGWVEVLQSDADVAAKATACRALKAEGTAESVAALGALLTDPRLSHEARMALESIPGPEASAALRAAAAETEGVLRAGILDSLGERRDPEAVEVAASALDDDDLAVVTSAALALGKIGTHEAIGRLEQSYGQAATERQTVLGDGLICGALGLRQAGQIERAAAIFDRLAAPSQPPAVRSAALLGQLRVAGDELPETVRRWLADDDPLIRASAAAVLPDLTRSGLQTVVAEWQHFAAESQVLVLAAIRFRGDPTFAPAALAAAGNQHPAVARAGIEASGVLADSDGLDVLLPLATGDGPAAEAAWRAVEILHGDQTDLRLTRELAELQHPSHRVSLIRILAARQASSSVPVLIEYVEHEDQQVQAAAVDAIFRLALPEHVPALVRLMLGTARGSRRDALEKAVMLALEQVPDVEQRSAAVLTDIDGRSDPQRIELLPLLGRIGGQRSLEMIQAALQDADSEVYEAGMRAITNWPDASVVEQLADLARTARENHQRIWALRAMIRVSTLPSPLPDDRKLALLRRAMDMATRDDERSLALQRAGAIRTVAALQFAAAYLDHPRLAPDACRTVVELAHHKELRDANRAEFGPALKRVIAIASDPHLQDRAKRYLEELAP
jgi:HEAT repeat protein